MTRTLQKKFIVTAMIAITVLLVAVLGGLNVFNALSNANESERLLQIVLRDETSGRREHIQEGGAFGEPPEAPATGDNAFLLDHFTDEDRREVEGFMGRGGLLSGELTENDARAAVYFTVRFAAGGSAGADVSRLADVTQADAIALAEPLYASGETGGTASRYRYAACTQADGTAVYVFLDTASRSASVVRVLLLSLLLGLVAWGLMLLLVVLLSKRAIRPIAENMEKQRRFVTDAGHEIKTPLAIIQANTEAMELRTGETKYSKNIRDQVGRLSGLMQDLLTLAKADGIRTAETATLFSLSELVRSACESFQAPMELRALALDAEIAPELNYKGDRTLITRLVSILLDNAVKYASENSTLRLTLKKAERSAVFSLSNRCDALPDCPPEKLFDRFYRADEARTQSAGGYGIGLSAAQSIAQAHRGSLTAAYSDNNTIIFTAKLPIK